LSTRNNSLLAVLTHPTQYDPPIWAAIASTGALGLNVWYLEASPRRDSDIGAEVNWGDSRSKHYCCLSGVSGRLEVLLRQLDPSPAAVLLPGWRESGGSLLRRYCKRRGIPCILPTDTVISEPHSIKDYIRPYFHFIGSKMHDGFWTTGRGGVGYLRSLGVAHSRIAQGLYPVDVSWWEGRLAHFREDSSRLRRSLGGGVDTFTAIAVCKFAEREDPIAVLRAFSRARSKMQRPARLILVGDGPLRETLQEETHRLGLAGEVLMPGYVKYSDLAMYYGAADTFVHMPPREPWGISVCEAMACGLPVIGASWVGAAQELIEEGVTGWMSGPDVEGLGDRMCQSSQVQLSREAVLARAKRLVDVEVSARSLVGLVGRLSEKSVQ